MKKNCFLLCFSFFVNFLYSQGEVFRLTAEKQLNRENLDPYQPPRYLIVPKGTFCAAANKDIFTFEQSQIHTFEEVATVQTQTMWCWAACIKMVLNYQGVNTSQEEIVRRTFGDLINQGANCIQMANTADGWTSNGIEISSWYVGNLSSDEAIDALANHYPIIVGMDIPNQDINHAYVLTAVYYNSKNLPIAVALRDPWPENESLTHITWQEFENRLQCAVFVEPKK